ncbi:SusC/RagA family TonB-linked outer membrane protein [Chitinophaga sp. SYP-B3965]|uniref:SusC/RagA family TonB-linked outer membrane protein n=1 Tax=Chitinophaga sp. SYP-B3965 TaxID=2663120 RepID=UPI001299FFB7|nr:TonB-dependent receptor [Chitinophaga sp. SYP-B3965]MRG45149.1 SusC/RagA family TonB-linked outer membrane protein [Chitinophaga sp. SYP-B3965]
MTISIRNRLIIACCAFAMMFMLPCVTTFAQTVSRAVNGNIKDKTGRPVPGVTVVIQGTTTGTTSDNEGRFKINAPENAVLVFSFIGFQTQKLTTGSATSYNVILQDNTTELDQLVVVGYGTRKKSDVTGAVAQVKATQLENENPASVQDLLRANVPGLNVTSSNTAKGGGDLTIRGKSSINAGTTPLIVLDGVIYPGQLSDINPNDIQTIDVLKDASAAAVYGAKSAKGVLLINTKRGNRSKPTITFNSNIGVTTLSMDEPLYDGPGFVKWRTDVMYSVNANAKPYQFNDPRTLPSNITVDQWKAYDNSQGDPVDIWLNRLKILPVEVRNYKAGKTTNWYNQMFHHAFRQDHTVSISGKKEDISYYISAGYVNNEGVIVGDKFKTFRTRINLEAKAAKFMSVGINMQFADRDESQVPVAWGQMVNASPYGEKYKDDGKTLRDSPNDDVGNNTNPFLDNTYTNRMDKTNTLFGSLYLKGDLPWGFSYQSNFSPNFDFNRYFNGISAKDFRYAARKGIATRRQMTIYNWQIDNLLRWNKTFGDHEFDATFLFNAEKFQSWRNQMDNEGFDPNDNLSWHNIGSGIKPVIQSFDSVSTGDALMARLNYGFRGKYLLTASIRRDGYSAFGQRNPRADFPAVALSWVFSKEKFVDLAWLDYGKLRLSWGVNGNRDIGRYLALSDLTSGKYQYIQQNGQMVLVSQLYVGRLQNPNLKWEKSTSYNVGLDFSIFRDVLSGSIDVYKKSTTDLLILRGLPIHSGFLQVMDNLGEVENKGFELSLNSANIRRNGFKWSTNLNFTLNRNKIKHLYGEVDIKDASGKVIGREERDDVANRWFIGHDLDAIWDLKVLGVWQVAEAAEAAKFGVKPGDFKLEDVNKDGKFSDADRQFLGYRSPRFQWTLRNDFSYRNFDFSFMFYSNWGSMGPYSLAKNNSGFIDRQNSYQLPYWTPENPTNDYARLFSSNGSATFDVYRKTSFVRLSTISLGYTLPVKAANRIGLDGVKIYGNVNNIGVYQPDWTFWDAEYIYGDNNPPVRNYSFGINITL